MGYVQFLAWVGKQGLKSKVLQKSLNKVWQEAVKGGKIVLESHFPKLLKSAKNIVKKEPPKTVTDKLGRVFEEKVVESAKILPFKRPPGKFKGGIIDKALSGRSRDI